MLVSTFLTQNDGFEALKTQKFSQNEFLETLIDKWFGHCAETDDNGQKYDGCYCKSLGQSGPTQKDKFIIGAFLDYIYYKG